MGIDHLSLTVLSEISQGQSFLKIRAFKETLVQQTEMSIVVEILENLLKKNNLVLNVVKLFILYLISQVN